MARGPHLSELAAEWQALGAKPQHVRRIFLAWAGLAPWEARKGESFPKAVAEALPDIIRWYADNGYTFLTVAEALPLS